MKPHQVDHPTTRRRIATLALALALAAIAAIAWTEALFGTALPDASTQTIRNPIYLLDSHYSRLVAKTVRAYPANSPDTSSTRFQLGFTWTTACSCYVSDATMENGDPIRAQVWDVYTIDGPDTLRWDNLPLWGNLIGAFAVDDSSLATDAVSSRAILDGTIGSADLEDGGIQSDDYGVASIPNSALGAGVVSEANLDPTIHFVVGDSLVLGHHTPAAAGFLYQYDGASKRVSILPSASMTGHASFYWPISTGSTYALLQRTATGSAWTLTPGSLTSITATTGSFTKISQTGTGVADSSLYRNNLNRFLYGPTCGGYGIVGQTRFLRDGYTWTLRPSNLAASGTTEVVFGSASTGNLAYYSVSGSTESIVPTADPSVSSVTASGALQTGNAASAGSVKVYDGSSNYSTISLPASSTNPTFSLPTTNGTNGYGLTTNGSGVTSWTYIGGTSFLAGSVTFTDAAGWYRQGFYVAGMTTNHKAVLTVSWDRVTDGAWVGANGPWVKCKTDSLIVTFASSPTQPKTINYWAFVP